MRFACLDDRLLAADFHRTRGLSEEGRHVLGKAARVRGRGPLGWSGALGLARPFGRLRPPLLAGLFAVLDAMVTAGMIRPVPLGSLLL